MNIIYTITVFLGSFLLFSIQPMAAKMILPSFGGASFVWISSMMFFQGMLLLGYFYAHKMPKIIGLKNQAKLHIALLIISLVFIPISFGQADIEGGYEIPKLLFLLAVCLGLPFLLLSANAAMLMNWLARSGEEKNPHRLYVASNAGSFIGLLSYPFIVEPLSTLAEQGKSWAGLYIVLMGGVIVLGYFLIKEFSLAGKEQETRAEPKQEIRFLEKLKWTGIAFVPASLLMGITTYITTDVAPAPLFWVIPLAIYLLSFILSFSAGKPLYYQSYNALPPLIILAVFFNVIQGALFLFLVFHLLCFFVVCIVCHGMLADRRPANENITDFYLYIALGGFLGGAFNVMVAPNIFPGIYEYPLMLIAARAIRPYNEGEEIEKIKISNRAIIDIGIFLAVMWMAGSYWEGLKDNQEIIKIKEFLSGKDSFQIIDGFSMDRLGALRLVIFLGAIYAAFKFRKRKQIAVISLLIFYSLSVYGVTSNVILQKRNNYGVIQVSNDENLGMHLLRHGSTVHGFQIKSPAEEIRLRSGSYYGTPLVQIMNSMKKISEIKEIAGLGLGAGTIACYNDADGRITFFEIDKKIVEIASNPELFTYLSECPGKKEIVMGDARLSLAKQENRKFDFMVIDVFNSDAIPIHLLTKEAMQVYLDKMQDDGVIALHLSNRYLNLVPIIAGLAKEYNLAFFHKFHHPSKEAAEFPSIWAAVAKNPESLKELKLRYAWEDDKNLKKVKMWTDGYSNLLEVMLF